MSDVTLFGELRCHKTRFYIDTLKERGVDYELAEVDRDPNAFVRLEALTGSGTKFPTFEIKGRKLRNPKLRELDKMLARANLYNPGLIHDDRSQRYVRHMAPSDAFVSYTRHGQSKILTHTEVDPSLRGKGVGAKVVAEVFDTVLNDPHPVRITCPYMRKVAATRPDWATKFLNGD